MRKLSDLDILSFIDDTFLGIEVSIKDEKKIRQLIKEARIKMYSYTSKVPKPMPKHGIIKMMYSEDIERLFNAGFTDTQIATITGVPLIEIQKYLKRKKLIK